MADDDGESGTWGRVDLVPTGWEGCFRRPGVALNPEAPANSALGVVTSLPAFVGHTATVELGARSLIGEVHRVRSLDEYEELFGPRPRTRWALIPQEPGGAGEAREGELSVYEHHLCDGRSQRGELRGFLLEPAAPGRFVLYDAVALFFANGGRECDIVSAGGCDQPVSLSSLRAGLDALRDREDVTIVAIPDAACLPRDREGPGSSPFSSQFAELCQALLAHVAERGDRVALLDVYGSERLAGGQGSPTVDEILACFHQALDTNSNHAAAYFPFLRSSAIGSSAVDFTCLADLAQLRRLLSWSNSETHGHGTPQHAQVQAHIDAIASVDLDDHTAIAALDARLQAGAPLLAKIEAEILARERLIPPSAAMAGVYTAVDESRGVWIAPTSVPLASVSGLSFEVDDRVQVQLDRPADGKSIDAIRAFRGRGVLVWGARTLDGDSDDFRYINVRRTLIYVEKSLRRALDTFALEPNEAKTWSLIRAALSGFLTKLWAQGCLVGDKPGDAFSINLSAPGPRQLRARIEVAIIRPGHTFSIEIQQAQGV